MGPARAGPHTLTVTRVTVGSPGQLSGASCSFDTLDWVAPGYVMTPPQVGTGSRSCAPGRLRCAAGVRWAVQGLQAGTTRPR